MIDNFKMLGQFKNFVSTAWNAVTGFFANLSSWFQRVLAGTKAEVKGQNVQWSFPDYAAMAQETASAPANEVTVPGDKGRMIAHQMRQAGLVNRSMTSNQTEELESNVTRVASYLGYAFETGVVAYLAREKKLRVIGGWTLEKIEEKHHSYVNRVKEHYELSSRSTKARDKFIELLQHNVARMGEEVFRKSGEMMMCNELQTIEYVGMDQFAQARSNASTGNIGGADLVVSCGEGGEDSYWSTKYVSNAHSSIAQRSPADVHRMFGGRGARSDGYYDRINASYPPDIRADAVLFDLWESLKSGWAVDAAARQSPNKIILKGEWAVGILQQLLRGDVGTSPAWMNYARGSSAVGDYSPAMKRDMDLKNGELKARPGAYAEASLDGAYRISSFKPGMKKPKPAIKIKLVTPGQQGMRQTYLKFYVNEGSDRYAKYNVQVQMNNLTTQ